MSKLFGSLFVSGVVGLAGIVGCSAKQDNGWSVSGEDVLPEDRAYRYHFEHQTGDNGELEIIEALRRYINKKTSETTLQTERDFISYRLKFTA